MLSDYMSGLVLLDRRPAAGERCLTWHPIMVTALRIATGYPGSDSGGQQGDCLPGLAHTGAVVQRRGGDCNLSQPAS